MSGTPTTGSNSEEGLKQLFNLLQFLRHPDYIDEGSEEVWKMQVIQRCLSQNQNAWSKLYELLQSIMVRHTKVKILYYSNIFKLIHSAC